jgi:YegS/Rv2252/BmrU family lipid kinase
MGNCKTAFIINPQAGNGSTGRSWPGLAPYARKRLGAFQALVTKRPGDAFSCSRHAVEAGVERLICMGGDGTLNEVVNGIMAVSDNHANPVLGIVPNGTGCDLVRTLSIPRDVRAAVDLIAANQTHFLDIGRLTFQGPGKRTVHRYFHNITSFGIGGEVDARVNRTTKAFGPFLSFMWATLISVLSYDKKQVRLRTESGVDQTVRVWNVAIANGQFHGGGMWVAPEARVDDGRFHITVIGDLSLAAACRNLPRLYNGRIGRIAQVSMMTATRIEAESAQKVLLDVDGEQPGRLPLSAEIVPRALRIIA